MGEKEKLSRTIRIDLIPEVSQMPTRKGVVISGSTQRHKRVQINRPTASSQTRDLTEDAKYNELLQNIYDGALICKTNGRVMDANVRAVEFLLYSREELCSMMVFDVISGGDESLIQTLCDNLENERFTLIQAYCVRKDGSFFPAEISVNKLRLGEMHLCFFIRDITARRQAEEMLRTEHNAIQNAGNGIAVIDLDAMIEYANPALAAMWGFEDFNELMGQDVRTLLTDKDAANEMIASVLGERESWEGEMKTASVNGNAFEVQVSAACNRNSDGEAVGIVLSFVNISDRKRAEQAEREAERTKVMLESLGAACHHLGQPATVLLANLGIIQRRMKSEDPIILDLVTTSMEAVESLGEVLHKLNSVNTYKTTQYLESPEGSDAPENRIIEI